jgi:peptidoglycan L-alanyl-D-glutamate endopeptidase CwlK
MNDAPVDERSEKAIATLLPEVRPYARALLNEAKQQGIKLIITSATRTFEEQDALFAQGRTKPGRIVTHVRGGYSNHNYGIAFDVTVFRGNTPIWECADYKIVGAIGRRLGLSWGGDWSSFIDEPHFELRPQWAREMTESAMLAELRRRHMIGTGVFA